MKKLFFVLYACLCVGLWSCSNDCLLYTSDAADEL